MKRSDRVQQELEWMEGFIARMQAMLAESQQASARLEAELAERRIDEA